MNDILKELMYLTKQKDYFKIKELLYSTDKSIKGPLFENYLATLFKGNGFIATLNGKKGDGGADILLSKADNPSKILWIIQAKNQKTPLGENEILSEIIKYENKSKKIYKDSVFKIISLTGYTQYQEEFNQLDVALDDFDYIKQLIDNYSSDTTKLKLMLPDLKPHNKWSYNQAVELFKNHNKVTVPNATGTGKSYIVAQFLYDYINKNKIILAPNKEILEQQLSICPWSKKNTIYMTYSKLINEIDSDLFKSKRFDFIVLDELHRTGAKKWGESVEKLLSYNPNAKVLALSATPVRNLDNNRNMINELTDGIHTKPLTLFDAISRDI